MSAARRAAATAAPLLPPEPLCVLCVGDGLTEGRTCPRCAGTCADPDPLAPILEAASPARDSGRG